MKQVIQRRTVLAALAAFGFAGLAQAQQAGPLASGYPDRSIELVVPY